jgi:hypothetical protein
VIDASDLLAAPQLAGVVVSPVGLFRKIESSMTVISGGVVVPGSTGPAISDKLTGARAAEQREADAGASAGGDVPLADSESNRRSWVGGRLGEIVERVPRSAITAAELEGGWRHPTLYMFSSAPLRITFADGTSWVFEVARFYRRHAKRVVRALGHRTT